MPGKKVAPARGQGTGLIMTAAKLSLSSPHYTPVLPQLQAIDNALAAMHASVGDAAVWLGAFGAFLDAVEAVQR